MYVPETKRRKFYATDLDNKPMRRINLEIFVMGNIFFYLTITPSAE
jgi:hypothetical protein